MGTHIFARLGKGLPRTKISADGKERTARKPVFRSRSSKAESKNAWTTREVKRAASAFTTRQVKRAKTFAPDSSTAVEKGEKRQSGRAVSFAEEVKYLGPVGVVNELQVIPLANLPADKRIDYQPVVPQASDLVVLDLQAELYALQADLVSLSHPAQADIAAQLQSHLDSLQAELDILEQTPTAQSEASAPDNAVHVPQASRPTVTTVVATGSGKRVRQRTDTRAKQAASDLRNALYVTRKTAAFGQSSVDLALEPVITGSSKRVRQRTDTLVKQAALDLQNASYISRRKAASASAV